MFWGGGGGGGVGIFGNPTEVAISVLVALILLWPGWLVIG